MSMFKKMALAALFTSAAATGAFAADLNTMPTPVPMEAPVAQQAAFDWNGFYAGVYGGAQNSSAGGMQYGLGVNVGVNAAFDFYLLGGEVAIHGLTGGAGSTSYAEVLGRAGVIVTDNVMVYGAAGYGIDLGAPNEDDILAGGGVELALTDNVSLRGQYLHGFPITGGNPKDQITIGAAYHF